MFFVDKPYVSEFFKATVRDNAIPIVNTEIARSIDLYPGTNFISEDRAIKIIKKSANPRIYMTSENSLDWISKYLDFSDLPKKIDLFKNKVKFRRLVQTIFPDFYFQETCIEELERLSVQEIPLPCIVKPTIGFFSLGVHKVANDNEWPQIINSLIRAIPQFNEMYPESVLNGNSLIIEQYFEGEEFAIDAYYDSLGQPIILGIFKHIFSSNLNFSDRVYFSSKKIIENNLEVFTDLLKQIGDLVKVKNFPIHLELRRSKNGSLCPIEINPMRFGGWCTTADLTFLAYGFNPYLYFYNQKKPDWSECLKGKEDKLFSFVILDNSTGKNIKEISSFDYKKLLSSFEKTIELRKIDRQEYPLFGILFLETREDNFLEIKNILDSDLSEFI